MAEENNEQIIEDDPIEVRRAKREALLAEGKNLMVTLHSSTPITLSTWMKSTPSWPMAKTPKMLFPLRAVLWPSVFRQNHLLRAPGCHRSHSALLPHQRFGRRCLCEMKDLDLGDWIALMAL